MIYNTNYTFKNQCGPFSLFFGGLVRVGCSNIIELLFGQVNKSFMLFTLSNSYFTYKKFIIQQILPQNLHLYPWFICSINLCYIHLFYSFISIFKDQNPQSVKPKNNYSTYQSMEQPSTNPDIY